jgi:chemotaxis protein histidine kinase CheA
MSMSKVVKVIEECGKMYNFDVEDALRALKIEKVSSKVEGSKKLKLSFPMPFGGVKNENCCNGIVKNHGLYTQCEKKPMLVKEGEVKSCFCKGCQEEPYGNIDDRVSKGLYEFKDPKGKSPKRYTEVLKKLKIAKETVEEETKRLNLTINAVHFEEVVEENVKRGRPKAEKKVKEPTGKKGRPKKEKKTVEVSEDLEEDLFASLIAKAQSQPLDQPLDQPLEKVEPNSQENVIVEEVNEVLAEPLPKVEKKAKKVDPAKEAEKQKKAEEKAAKEAAKEAEKQKKAEEKAAKEAEKLKKAEEKAAKEATKESKKKSKDLAKPLPTVEKEEEADVVKKIEFGGKSYYKSNKNGVIYNMEQEVVGKWNAETNDIDFEEEEEEEEYDD